MNELNSTLKEGLLQDGSVQNFRAPETRERIYWSDAEEEIIATAAAEKRREPANIRAGLCELINDAILERLPENRRRHIATLSAIPKIADKTATKYFDLITQPIKEVIIEKPAPLNPEKTLREFSSAEIAGELARRKEVFENTQMQVFALLLGKGNEEVAAAVKQVQKINEPVKIDRAKRIGLIMFADGQIDALKRMTPNHDGDFVYVIANHQGQGAGRLFNEEVDLYMCYKPRASTILKEQLARSESIKPKLVWVETMERAKVAVLDFYMGKSMADYRN